METRERILAVAEHLARTKGYDGFSYADVEAKVGIRKASIHHHFPKKADLAVALMLRYRRSFESALKAVTERHATAAQRLGGYLDLYRSGLSGGRTLCLCISFNASRESLPTAAKAELNRFHGVSIEWLSKLFALAKKDGSVQCGANVNLEAAATLALVEGAMLIARAAEDASAFDTAVFGLKERAR